MDEEKRTAAIRRAKRLGKTFALYAADNYDRLPAKDADLQDLLGPYLMNRDELQDFDYTFEGGSVAEVPATRELGFTDDPGGRIIVTFAEGEDFDLLSLP
ncbi:MAG: hypothetical protein ACR2HJ_11730 [Fimbriimonadales bacterium]